MLRLSHSKWAVFQPSKVDTEGALQLSRVDTEAAFHQFGESLFSNFLVTFVRATHLKSHVFVTFVCATHMNSDFLVTF